MPSEDGGGKEGQQQREIYTCISEKKGWGDDCNRFYIIPWVQAAYETNKKPKNDLNDILNVVQMIFFSVRSKNRKDIKPDIIRPVFRHVYLK